MRITTVVKRVPRPKPNDDRLQHVSHAFVSEHELFSARTRQQRPADDFGAVDAADVVADLHLEALVREGRKVPHHAEHGAAGAAAVLHLRNNNALLEF